ncbi:outer membrane protein transport protein [Halomonas sp. XH26]|uniref:Outer membrane protein transport protein n=1 Tax=Vreelandella alkaliphila TaxID=272774 RepID=A0AAJ2S362_9GAMM|nr:MULTISPECIES: TonB-dependent receptor [Halomonas]AIA74892.1 Long-chain fatty acid transport protein [Halomonas campaniensis]AYF32974.1 Long-chain fatty acid transport protein [Halomonas alkaliphila]MCD6005940.1 outer membrane protein transport protein [Halomonas sp. IOP_6]MCD6439431.1 outer membrane protein transport protein [Halomonas sp.]MDX5978455.1 outer membrane protein transport protein [Halomonas alkaliphila]
MHNKFKKLTLAAAVASVAFVSQAQAGGYQINEQSVSGQGYGHAGRSSNVHDATIVYGNPAGMSFLDRAQITVGGTFLNVNSDISNVRASQSSPAFLQATGGATDTLPVAGTNDGDMVPGTLIPFAFYAHPVNEKLAFGFGVYAPFGSKTEYENGFQGRNQGNYTEVKVMTAQPTVSYRFNEQWSVGAGLTYNRVEGELRRQVPVATPLGLSEVDSRVEGDDEAWGYNLGVIYQPAPETTFGLTYRSKVDFNLEGSFAANSPVLDQLGIGTVTDTAALDLTTPETVNFSLTQEMSDKLKLMFGVSWARWSRFDQILVTGTERGEITNEQQNYSNAWAFSTGGEYQLTPTVALRAGVALDFTPTQDETRSVRIPSDDRRIFSIGAGWSPTPDLTLDVAYSYLTERSTQVDQSKTDSFTVAGQQTPPITSNYSADYKNEAHGFGAQLTYRF